MDKATEIKRVHVGCGPHNLLPDWCNADIQNFPGVDQVLDVTRPWPFKNLEYVYAEHFLEHLTLEKAIDFLRSAWNSLKVRGVIRLSTPSLEWVLSTHFDLSENDPKKHADQTLTINRAFHGWGHQFLYSKDFLSSFLTELGWDEIEFCEYGQSQHSSLIGIERHGDYWVTNGYPSVWIVEATKFDRQPDLPSEDFKTYLNDTYLNHVKSGR